MIKTAEAIGKQFGRLAVVERAVETALTGFVPTSVMYQKIAFPAVEPVTA